MNAYFTAGDFEFKKDRLFFILGPCVIEDEETTFRIAEKIKNIADEVEIPFIFKASFDKANRSSIHSYRGPGLEKGLEILARVKDHFKIPVLSDIHETWQA
jgi:2-dehydro-3-deoxyphosphooctonate aldolase (KDO 8-P synthase)